MKHFNILRSIFSSSSIETKTIIRLLVISFTLISSASAQQGNSGSGQPWKTFGNDKTDPNLHFLGTTNNSDLIFKTNNFQRMRITKDGLVEFSGNAIPSLNLTFDLGSSTQKWNNIYTNGLSLGNFTPKSIIFVGQDGFLAESSSQLCFDFNNSRLGIGTVNPTEALDVVGNIHTSGGFIAGSTTTYADGSITMSSGENLNIDSGTLFINNGGNSVGIGTTTPASLLHIFRSATSNTQLNGGSFFLTSGNNSASPFTLISTGNANPFRIINKGVRVLEIKDNGNVAMGVNFPSENLDIAKRVRIRTIDQNNSLTQILVADANGVINYRDAATLISNDNDWNIIGSDLESAVSGNVGIGLSNPQSKLHILHGSSLTSLGLQTGSQTQGQLTGIGFGASGVAGRYKAAIGFIETTGQGLGDIIFAQRNAPDGSIVSSADEVMRITRNGNVGIGTSSIQSKLHVSSSVSSIFALGIQNESNIIGELTGIGFGSSSTSGRFKAGIGFVRTASGGRGDIIFAQRNTADGAVVTGSDEVMRIRRDGRVGIGTPNPTHRLSVNGDASKLGGGSWKVFSDKKLKKDINPFEHGLDIIMNINPITFRYNGKADINIEEEFVGVIAQELEEVAPFMVSETFFSDISTNNANSNSDPRLAGETYLTVDPSAFDYLLINSVQEQQQVIEDMESKMELLETVVKELSVIIAGSSIGQGTYDENNGGKLYQNYPNPFMESTIISYELSESGFVELGIYSLSGELVTDLVNQFQSTGSYATEWNAENADMGIYIYILTLNGGELMKKMILIK